MTASGSGGVSAAPPTVTGLLLARAGDPQPGLRFEDRSWSWREHVAECARYAAALRARRSVSQHGTGQPGPGQHRAGQPGPGQDGAGLDAAIRDGSRLDRGEWVGPFGS